MNDLLNKIEFSIKEIDYNPSCILYKVSIKVPMDFGWIERMKFIIEDQKQSSAIQLRHVKNEDNFVFFETEVLLDTKAIYHYYFSFEANNNFIYYKNKNKEDYKSISKEDMFKMSVNFNVPEWAQGKMMYHIFVDRFNRGSTKKLKEMSNRRIHDSWDEDIIITRNENGLFNTDFYGGDLRGIGKKLDYLKELGVSIIYLSPIVWSQSNHRYDTSDYEKVDPYLGTNKDLYDLCNKAHKLGMKVILDAVFNHTGNDSKYFNEYNTFPELGAYQSKDSKYYPFYRKYIDNNKVVFDYWWGMKNLPVCDGNNSSWQRYIYGEGGIIDLWFSLGIDGLRLDVADELSDGFIEGVRRAVKRNKEDGFIMGEVWKNPMHMNRSYLESGKGMDTVMNYQLTNALIRYFKYKDCDTLKEVLTSLIVEYPEESLNSIMNFTSTHDISRPINIFGSKEFKYQGEWVWDTINNDREYQKNYKLSEEEYNKGKEIFEAYIFTLAFLPGNLSIFYGDEIGMQGLGNIANRRPYTWTKKDTELLELFKVIGKIRKKEKFLEKASLEIIEINPEYLLFKRKNNEEELLVYINRSKNEVKIIPEDKYTADDLIYNLNNSSYNNLNPYGGIVLKKKN